MHKPYQHDNPSPSYWLHHHKLQHHFTGSVLTERSAPCRVLKYKASIPKLHARVSHGTVTLHERKRTHASRKSHTDAVNPRTVAVIFFIIKDSISQNTLLKIMYNYKLVSNLDSFSLGYFNYHLKLS